MLTPTSSWRCHAASAPEAEALGEASVRRVCRGAGGPRGGDDDEPFPSGWLLGVAGLPIPSFPSCLLCVSNGTIAAGGEVGLPVPHPQQNPSV